jgi:hypothetical protein
MDMSKHVSAISIQRTDIGRASLLLAKSDRKMLYSNSGKSQTYFPPTN